MKHSETSQASPHRQEPSLARRRLLFLLLILTLVRGLIYLAALPPWQHYDEPTHFEYVRLIAERRQFPKPGDYDLEMRREIAASMKAEDFWIDYGDPLIDFWSDEPPGIGITELNHPPLYYAIQAIPQLLVAQHDVETQLYLARLVSVLLYLLIVASAYGLVREVFPERQWLPLATATFIALLPPFTDLMSSVNNDVGAVAVVNLLLWASVRLVRRGASLKRIAVILLLAATCIFTKSTAAVIAVVDLLVLTVALVPSRYRRWLWLGLIPLLPLVLFLTFSWGDHAAGWYSDIPPAEDNRIVTSTPLGRAAFALSSGGEPYARTIFQELEHSDGQSLLGQTVTLGAWLKTAGQPSERAELRLDDGQERYSRQVEVTNEWQFHVLTATVGTDAPGVAAYVILSPSIDGSETIFVDGIVLVEGEMPSGEVPEFATEQAREGQWGGHPFTNLLRNGSAERNWPGMRNWIGNSKIYRQPVAMVFHSTLDWIRTKWAYWGEMLRLLHSFWGRFAWSHLLIPTSYLYILAAVTIAGIIGFGLAVIRRLRSSRDVDPWRWEAWLLLGLVWLVGWGGTILRLHPMLLTRNLAWPMARYAAVSIVPTATFLCLGLAEITPRRWTGWLALVGASGLVTLDAIVLLTIIVPYYYG